MATLPYDVVIFDLDGTLTESEPGITKSVKYSLDALGWQDYSMDQLRAFIGPPLFESYTRTLGMDDETARRGVDLYRERFSKVGWQENSVYRGVPHMLRSLKKNGAYLAVATSKPTLFTEKILRRFGLFGFFDRVIAADPNTEHSDKPELVRRALPKSHRRACMIGDRKFDMKGAVENKIDGIGVLHGYGDEPELRAAGAAHITNDIAELTSFLLGGCPEAEGLFISLEGADGCGKSTQAPVLANWLEQLGYDVVQTREPGGCPIAERIRGVVLDPENKGMTDLTEALLFAASRAQHVHDVIRPAIARGKMVMCDRYVDSSVAYQGVGRGLGIELVRGLNAPGVSACMPDLTVLFDLNPKEGLSRRNKSGAPDRIEQTAEDFIQATHEFYHQLAIDEPDRVRAFDANGTREDVSERLRIFASERLCEIN